MALLQLAVMSNIGVTGGYLVSQSVVQQAVNASSKSDGGFLATRLRTSARSHS